VRVGNAEQRQFGPILVSRPERKLGQTAPDRGAEVAKCRDCRRIEPFTGEVAAQTLVAGEIGDRNGGKGTSINASADCAGVTGPSITIPVREEPGVLRQLIPASAGKVPPHWRNGHNRACPGRRRKLRAAKQRSWWRQLCESSGQPWMKMISGPVSQPLARLKLAWRAVFVKCSVTEKSITEVSHSGAAERGDLSVELFGRCRPWPASAPRGRHGRQDSELDCSRQPATRESRLALIEPLAGAKRSEERATIGVCLVNRSSLARWDRGTPQRRLLMSNVRGTSEFRRYDRLGCLSQAPNHASGGSARLRAPRRTTFAGAGRRLRPASLPDAQPFILRKNPT